MRHIYTALISVRRVHPLEPNRLSLKGPFGRRIKTACRREPYKKNCLISCLVFLKKYGNTLRFPALNVLDVIRIVLWPEVRWVTPAPL